MYSHLHTFFQCEPRPCRFRVCLTSCRDDGASDRTVGARGVSGNGPPAAAPHAPLKGVSCTIMVQWEANAVLAEPGRL